MADGSGLSKRVMLPFDCPADFTVGTALIVAIDGSGGAPRVHLSLPAQDPALCLFLLQRAQEYIGNLVLQALVAKAHDGPRLWTPSC